MEGTRRRDAETREAEEEAAAVVLRREKVVGAVAEAIVLVVCFGDCGIECRIGLLWDLEVKMGTG